jgi:hypothetical protein
MGGIPVLACVMVLLAAVPAAFQYGLWDSNTQERSAKLELLLLTHIDASDFWDAATSAAWMRGRGYMAVAIMLWLAAVGAGRMTPVQLFFSVAASIILWGFYFGLSFRAFSRGLPAHGLGLALTVGLPLLALVLSWMGWRNSAAFLLPGSIYECSATVALGPWLAGPVVCGLVCLAVSRRSLAICERELRAWLDRSRSAGTG